MNFKNFNILKHNNFIIILTVGIIFFNLCSLPVLSFDAIKNNNAKICFKSGEEIKKKIKELKRKERIEINKLYKSQNKLERTKTNINRYKKKLNTTKTKVRSLESNLFRLQREKKVLEERSASRIRNIYKGERLTLLHLIFESKDLNTFLDRIHYQKKLVNNDTKVLDKLRDKAKRLTYTKSSLEYQNNKMKYTLKLMNREKRSIKTAINVSENLINKLRTDRATYEAAQRELSKQSKHIERKLRTSSSKNQVSSKFIKPVAGVISSPFGWRRHPIFRSRSFHTGVDIAGRNRSRIRASNSGKVIHSGWYGGYGKVVIINHGKYKGKGTSSLYAHLSKTIVKVGQTVKKGQTIGYEGTTGYSTGPHLHFEIRFNGKPSNPMNLIR